VAVGALEPQPMQATEPNTKTAAIGLNLICQYRHIMGGKSSRMPAQLGGSMTPMGSKEAHEEQYAQVHTLGFAILGLLARGPLSGYDIALKLRRPIGFYWTAQHSQIYPELRRLSGEGFVTSGEPESGRRRRVYTITRSGRAELCRWIALPPGRPQPHDEVALKTFSVWMLKPQAAIALYRQVEAAHSLRLVEYQAMLAKVEAQSAGVTVEIDNPTFGTYATLVRGIGYEQGLIAWCQWVISRLNGQGGTPI